MDEDEDDDDDDDGGGVIGDVQPEAAYQAVMRAFELGINYFDTSPFYGMTKAETVLGNALERAMALGVKREHFVVSSKVGRYDQSVFDFRASTVLKSVESSLQRLHLDYLDLVICHDIEFTDLNIVVNEAIPALTSLVSAGKVRHIGISGYPLEVLDRCLCLANRNTDYGPIEVVLSYCHLNLFDQSLSGYLPAWKSRVGVISASPLGMGLLSDSDPPQWHPAAPELKQKCREVAQSCKERGGGGGGGEYDKLSISDIAIRYAFSEEASLNSLASVLIGIRSIEELEFAYKCATQQSFNNSAKLKQTYSDIKSAFKNVKTTWPSGNELTEDSLSPHRTTM